ncbi:helix-turn-helix domain-containing protein [Streptomyces rectiverticillatus]|nr:helix-turn-helix domain-containing protein [Streptomyces rectiverticillatus]QLE75740.1 helix-turn-helix domain-containing protein [Streptomyces rectiverticillatus]
MKCDPATVRRWIARFNTEVLAGPADRPRCGRPRLGGRRLTQRIAALLERPGPWTIPRLWRYLGRPRVTRRTVYRRVRQVTLWRRPKPIARGDPRRDAVAAAIVRRLQRLQRGAWCGPPTRCTCICCRTCTSHGRCPATGRTYWAALKTFVANTAVTWPGCRRQVHAFFRSRVAGRSPRAGS